MKYIHQNKIFDLEITDNSGYPVGSDITEQNEKFIALSDNQVSFLEANPNASVNEVWNMKLNDPVIMPEIPVAERRLNAFKYEKTIDFKGMKLSVDEGVLTMQSYSAEDRVSEVEELKGLIVGAKNEIRNRIV